MTRMMILDNLLRDDEVRDMRSLTKADIWRDGKSTAGTRGQRVKNNLQADPEMTRLQSQIVAAALYQNGAFTQSIRPAVLTTPVFSRYLPGMEYGLHVDAAMSKDGAARIDVSVTVFLSDPDTYDGGELCVEGHEPVKLPAGHAVVYPATTLHSVAPVTRGERLAAVLWVQSRLKDPAQRQLLMDLGSVFAHLQVNAPDEPVTDLAQQVYANLSRMWLD